MMGYDVRFIKPATVTRTSGLLIYTGLDFYGVYTPCLVEFYAYDAWGNNLPYPFTDSNSIQQMASSGIYGSNGVQSRLVAMQWVWDNHTVKGQAVTFRGWLYNRYGSLIDTFGPITA
jgi:hypothetical protein